jgi:poly-gamma-glutamate synthesis protein (capsule biosynthesis protein)
MSIFILIGYFTMDQSLTLFLCGDVMTGRGIDQILPHPNDPVIYESYLKNAKDYVKLAERANGPIEQAVDFAYIWGYAIGSMKEADARIVNLETSITSSEDYLNKGINYRMHPKNISCLDIANIDCCVLANNHVLDWGQKGLLETLESLEKAEIKYSGAGRNNNEAKAPCILSVKEKGRILVFSFGLSSSGIPHNWKATEHNPGLNVLTNLSMETIKRIEKEITQYKRAGDIIVASIHWGGNWGYKIQEPHRAFAHNLIDHAGVDIIHGHSSHHFKGLEVYKNKPIIYGCGDFLNDYEGISGHESYRSDLGLMYFVKWDCTKGDFVSLMMVPTQIRKLQINKPNKKDCNWIKNVLNREGKKFGTKAEWVNEHTLNLVWN